jgi:hypothetical protein
MMFGGSSHRSGSCIHKKHCPLGDMKSTQRIHEEQEVALVDRHSVSMIMHQIYLGLGAFIITSGLFIIPQSIVYCV